jgi:hypothetical protein
MVDRAAVNRNGHLEESCILKVAEKYRVVGVRADGTRVVVDEGLTLEQVHQANMLLTRANAFPDVWVEPDGPG